MTFLSELPQTDLTKFRLDDFFNRNEPEIVGAGLYLLELANSSLYIDDMFKSEYLNISDEIKDSYIRFKNYADITLPDKMVNANGALSDMIIGVSFSRLMELIRLGVGMLSITGSTLPDRHHLKVDITLGESTLLVNYLNNKKITPVTTESELVIIQEFIRKYDISDSQILQICRMLKMDELHRNYALLVDTHLPLENQVLHAEVYPVYVTSITNELEWPMLRKLEDALKAHIKPIPVIQPKGTVTKNDETTQDKESNDE